jgi:hypothetical protein
LQDSRKESHSHFPFLQSCNPAILQYHVVVDQPKHRPLERFWPYADLPEQPTDEELVSLDPDLLEALFGAQARPFSITLVFPALDARLCEGPRSGARVRPSIVKRVGCGPRYRARFWSSDPIRLRRDLSRSSAPRMRPTCSSTIGPALRARTVAAARMVSHPSIAA